MVEDDIRLGCGRESVWNREIVCQRVRDRVCVGVIVRDGGGVRESERQPVSVSGSH